MFSMQHKTVICGMSGCTIFFHVISQMTQFLKKVLKIKCVFTFSLKLLSETFLILRIIQQDIIINVQRYSGKVTIINNCNKIFILSPCMLLHSVLLPTLCTYLIKNYHNSHLKLHMLKMSVMHN